MVDIIIVWFKGQRLLKSLIKRKSAPALASVQEKAWAQAPTLAIKVKIQAFKRPRANSIQQTLLGPDCPYRKFKISCQQHKNTSTPKYVHLKNQQLLEFTFKEKLHLRTKFLMLINDLVSFFSCTLPPQLTPAESWKIIQH